MELEFIRLAMEEGVLACQPLPSSSGKLIESLPASVGEFCCVVLWQLLGERPTSGMEFPKRLFTSWCETLVLLHRAVDLTDPDQKRPRRDRRDVVDHFASWMPDTESGAARNWTRLSISSKSCKLTKATTDSLTETFTGVT